MRILVFYLLSVFSLAATAQSTKNDSLYITTSDSVKLFVKRSGSGYPVLFIHGGPGSNSYYFEKEGGNVFSKDVQLIYLDQRGCGRSDTALNNDYSLARVVKDFDEVRMQLGYKKWIVMPHSFGGILATEYANQYPETIEAMVYLNCTINLHQSAVDGIKKGVEILGNREADKEYFFNDSIPLFKRWGDIFGKMREEGVAYKLMFDKASSKSIDDSLMSMPFLKYVYAQKLWGYPEYFEDYAPKTAKLNMPVLIVSGRKDYTIGTEHYKIMQFPNKEIVLLPGGHALYLEHNKELYQAVVPFLRQHAK